MLGIDGLTLAVSALYFMYVSNHWKPLYSFSVVLTLIGLIMLTCLPESPKFLVAKQRYDKGVSSFLEVLETERSLFSVALKQSELQQNYRRAYVNLYKAIGGGWITPEELEEHNRRVAEEAAANEAEATELE